MKRLIFVFGIAPFAAFLGVAGLHGQGTNSARSNGQMNSGVLESYARQSGSPMATGSPKDVDASHCIQKGYDSLQPPQDGTDSVTHERYRSIAILALKNACSEPIKVSFCAHGAHYHPNWLCYEGSQLAVGQTTENHAQTIGAVCSSSDCSDLDVKWNATYASSGVQPVKPHVDNSDQTVAH